MIDQDVLFGLVQAAQEQQAAVEKALQGLQAQQVQLNNTIAKLQNLQANVTLSAENGVKDAIKGIGAGLNASLKVEVDGARRTLRGMAEDLEKASSGLTWRWMFACLILGAVIGYIACWAMWTRDLAGVGPRLDAIEQTLRQTAAPAVPVLSPEHRGQRKPEHARSTPAQVRPDLKTSPVSEEKP